MLTGKEDSIVFFDRTDASSARNGINGDGAAGQCGSPGAAVSTTLMFLLQSAQQAVLENVHEARRCIAEAMALLRAERGLRNSVALTRAQRPLAPWQVTRVLEFVEANLGNHIGIADLAAQVRLSASYFAHAFRRSAGETPSRYLRRRRIERAQQMMLLTDKPLAEIALDCGLADQTHLTKVFRRIVGMSPGAWRRLRRAAPRELRKAPDHAL
jgi:AraC family transcriptional regulator